MKLPTHSVKTGQARRGFPYTTNQSEIRRGPLNQMTPIRFATAIRQFSKERGGMEKYLVELCNRMAEEGFEVHVYTERWTEENPKIHLHPVRTIPFPKSLRILSFAVRATREIERGNYHLSLGVGHTLRADVFQPHGGVHWAWFWRSLQAYDCRVLWVLKFLGRILSPAQWVSGWIEGAPYRQKKPPKIIAISDMVKEDILHWYAIPEEKMTVIYNGVDLERFHPRNRRHREEVRRRHGIGNEFVLLFVSNNFRMRGLGHLLRALRDIKKETFTPFRLIVLGRDRKEPYLRLAKRLGLLKEVVFVGSTEEPEKYYGAADLLAHPSFYDACSLTVLEALASGLPVVTTTATGTSGILNHQEEGWIIESTVDRRTLKTAIVHFIDKNVRHRASQQARQKVEAYSEQENFGKVMRVFQETLENNKSLPGSPAQCLSRLNGMGGSLTKVSDEG
jgi:UDP-glucose:(heptosyl)LPS alpha-1,3-glucosyltransferase